MSKISKQHYQRRCKKLEELKITTKDEGYLVLFKNFASCNCSVRKLATTMQIFSDRINANQTSISSDLANVPSAEELAAFSHRKKNVLQKAYAKRVA